MKTIKRIPLLILAAFLFSLSAVAAEKPAGTEAPSPIVVYQSKFPVVLEGHEYDLLTMVLDLPTGAGFPRHFHGGNVLVTVLSGEVTLEQDNVTKVIKTGENWTEKPGDVHAVINKGASARGVAVMLLPKGAAETTMVK
jgi:quercetin dioxygenase-like cupin family protein